MIKAVVFDIGKVLVGFDPRHLYEKLISDSDELDRFLTEVVTLEWHTEFDRGVRFADGIQSLSDRFPQHRDLITVYDPRWFETIPFVIEGTVALVKELAAKGVPLYALTNFSAEKFPEFRTRYPFMGHFRDIIVSGEERVVKPDPAIYEITERRTGCTGPELLFIDDRQENIDAAIARGWHGHVFDGADRLRAELVARGII